MIRHLSAFLLALLLGMAHADIPVLKVYPTQVAPGGLLQVTIGRQSGMDCTAAGTPLRIWIGSHSYSAECESKGGAWFLLMNLPPEKQTNLLPQEGPQSLTVLREGEVRSGAVSAAQRNVEILPVTGVIAAETKNISTSTSLNLGQLFPIEGNDRNDSAALKAAREKVRSAVSKLTLNMVSRPNSGNAPAGSLCGFTVYGASLDALPGPLKANIGLLIQQAIDTYGSLGIIIAPDTGKQPPSAQHNPLELTFEPSNQTAWNSIHWPSPSTPVTPGTPIPVVYIIDTYDGNSDVYQPKRVYDGRTYQTRGHGAVIEQLISQVVPELAPSQFRYKQACNKDGVCQIVSIIEGLCLAARDATAGRRVIVNLSFATPSDHPLLKLVVADALRADVTVVTAYGNNDRCSERASSLLDFCNAHPADWTANPIDRFPWKNLYNGVPWTHLYSVGASRPGEATPESFQRGQARQRMSNPAQKANPAQMSVATQPSLLAPGLFWVKSGTVSGPAAPYWGTSFSTPLVTGALARWVLTCHNGWPTPQQLKRTSPSDPRLDLYRIPNTCPY